MGPLRRLLQRLRNSSPGKVSSSKKTSDQSERRLSERSSSLTWDRRPLMPVWPVEKGLKFRTLYQKVPFHVILPTESML